MRRYSKWYRTGDIRIAPWWFGIMRAEFLERRDITTEGAGDTYQLRWVGAGRLPAEYDGSSAFGFWSTMATPGDDEHYGDRRFWRWFIQYKRSGT